MEHDLGDEYSENDDDDDDEDDDEHENQSQQKQKSNQIIGQQQLQGNLYNLFS